MGRHKLEFLLLKKDELGLQVGQDLVEWLSHLENDRDPPDAQILLLLDLDLQDAVLDRGSVKLAHDLSNFAEEAGRIQEMAFLKISR